MNEVQAADELRGGFFEYVLLKLKEAGGELEHEQLDELTGGARETAEALTELHSRRLVELPDSEGGRLTPFGNRVAARITESMTSGARRADAVQRAVLEWLAGPRTSEPAALGDFLDLLQEVNGQPVTEEELDQASELLVSRQYVQVIRTFQSAYLRPAITADGRAALMSDFLISEYGRPNATMISYDYSSSVNLSENANAGAVIAGGQGHQQNVVQTIGTAEKGELAAKVKALLDLVGRLPAGEAASDIRNSLEAASAEVAKASPSKDVVKDLAIKAVGSASAVLGTEAGHQVLEGLSQLAQMLN